VEDVGAGATFGAHQRGASHLCADVEQCSDEDRDGDSDTYVSSVEDVDVHDELDPPAAEYPPNSPKKRRWPKIRRKKCS